MPAAPTPNCSRLTPDGHLTPDLTLASKLRTLLLIAGEGLARPPRLAVAGSLTRISFQVGPTPQPLLDGERVLLDLGAEFARAHRDEACEERYRLAVASSLVRRTWRLLARPDPYIRGLGLVSFTEGQRELWALADGMPSPRLTDNQT